jgi:phytoene dehydrogenase-like protein
MPKYDVIVIGAGINGMTAAAVLAKSGRNVLVLEERERPGGLERLRSSRDGLPGLPLALDSGWLPPQVARAAGVESLERIAPAVPLIGLTPGPCLTLDRDPRRAHASIKRFSPRDADQWAAFVELIVKCAGFLSALYVLPPPDIAAGLGDLLPLIGVGRKLRKLGRRDMIELLRIVPMPVQELLDDRFESPLLKAVIGSCGVTGIRQGPRSGGTSFVLLHRQVGAEPGSFGLNGGGYWAAGPAALAEALTTRLKALGVELRTGVVVRQIMVCDDRVAGVVLENGDQYQAGQVISTTDPVRSMLSLVDPVWLDPELMLAIRNIKFRGSASRISFVLDGRPAFAGLDADTPLDGVLVLARSLESLEKAADAAKYGTVSSPPFITLRVPSARWAGLFPAAQHLVTAEVQWTPRHLKSGSWDGPARKALEDSVIAAIEEVSPGFRSRVRAMETLTPPDLEQQFGATEGALGQGELTLDQILFMRPVPELARYRTPIEGLFLGGCGSHPGPGISGAPGWLAAQAVLSRKG